MEGLCRAAYLFQVSSNSLLRWINFLYRLNRPEPPPRRPALLLRRGSKFRYSSGRTLEQMSQATYEPKDQSIYR